VLAKPAQLVDGGGEVAGPLQDKWEEWRFLVGAKDEGVWESRHESLLTAT
jgi:hypothetical protein